MASVRVWKPGDVLWLDGLTGLVVESGLGCKHPFARNVHVHYHDGDWDAHVPKEARPLVVIDPEDREQAAHLIRLWGDQYTSWSPDADGANADKMQAALRNIANPTPPIEEPTGLGAVVEAICGCIDERRRFIHDPLSTRFEGRPLDPARTWKASCGHHSWDVLTEVEILSEGIPAEAKS